MDPTTSTESGPRQAGWLKALGAFVLVVMTGTAAYLVAIILINIGRIGV